MANSVLANLDQLRICPWCGREFRPRRTGGLPQRFDRGSCRLAFFAAARAWSLGLLDHGLLSIDTLKISWSNVHVVGDPGQIDGL